MLQFATFMPLEKKTYCCDFNISLPGHGANIVITVLTKRIKAKVNGIKHKKEDQFGNKRRNSSDKSSFRKKFRA